MKIFLLSFLELPDQEEEEVYGSDKSIVVLADNMLSALKLVDTPNNLVFQSIEWLDYDILIDDNYIPMNNFYQVETGVSKGERRVVAVFANTGVRACELISQKFENRVQISMTKILMEVQVAVKER